MCITFVTTETQEILTNGTIQQSEESIRAALFRLLSWAFMSPRDMQRETVEEFKQAIPELPASIRESATRLVECWLEAMDAEEAFALAYSQLFLGPFEILSPPYASIYLEPDQKLMGEISASVAREYADAGLGPGSGPNEVPDHVALEWEYMYFLTHKFLTSGNEEWLTRRDRFMAEHMLAWLPQFSERVIEAEVHDFYTMLADIQIKLLDSWTKRYSDHNGI